MAFVVCIGGCVVGAAVVCMGGDVVTMATGFPTLRILSDAAHFAAEIVGVVVCFQNGDAALPDQKQATWRWCKPEQLQ